MSLHVRTAVVGVLAAVLAGASDSRVARAQSAPVAAQRVVQFDARTIAGDVVRVGPRTAPVLVAVFATWCRSCRDEVPMLNALVEELRARGVQFLAVNVDRDEPESVARWLGANHATYSAALDTTRLIARSLAVVGVPEFHLVSADGRVVYSRRGPLASARTSLATAINSVIGFQK